MTPTRKRRPSHAQGPVLVALAEEAGSAAYGAILDRMDYIDRFCRIPAAATWLAIESAGWVTVDRGTPDNRGGSEREYVYTLTAAGWAAIGREAPAAKPVVTYTGPAPCCDQRDSDPDHPRPDSTTRSYCRTCGEIKTQAYNRRTRSYTCVVCALAEYHSAQAVKAAQRAAQYDAWPARRADPSAVMRVLVERDHAEALAENTSRSQADATKTIRLWGAFGQALATAAPAEETCGCSNPYCQV